MNKEQTKRLLRDQHCSTCLWFGDGAKESPGVEACYVDFDMMNGRTSLNKLPKELYCREWKTRSGRVAQFVKLDQKTNPGRVYPTKGAR